MIILFLYGVMFDNGVWMKICLTKGCLTQRCEEIKGIKGAQFNVYMLCYIPHVNINKAKYYFYVWSVYLNYYLH